MDRILSWAGKYLVLLLLGSYLVAALFPGLGLALHGLTFVQASWVDGNRVPLTTSTMLLSVLLFNAGFGLKISELRAVLRRPMLVFIGVAANVIVPLLMVLGIDMVLSQWHDIGQYRNFIASLVLIVAMPIAGSSTAWSQISAGNLALSLGLVVLSTMLCPFTTRFTLWAMNAFHGGGADRGLMGMASGSMSAFLVYAVVLPSFLGIASGHVMGERRVDAVKPTVKFMNILILLFLNYCNAATSLPVILSQPDLGFLLVATIIAMTLCIASFGAGWILSLALGQTKSHGVSLMYGLGMNNNGSALVVGATMFPAQPLVLVPIIIYNLVQHVIAGLVSRFLSACTEDEVANTRTHATEPCDRSGAVSMETSRGGA